MHNWPCYFNPPLTEDFLFWQIFFFMIYYPNQKKAASEQVNPQALWTHINQKMHERLSLQLQFQLPWAYKTSWKWVIFNFYLLKKNYRDFNLIIWQYNVAVTPGELWFRAFKLNKRTIERKFKLQIAMTTFDVRQVCGQYHQRTINRSLLWSVYFTKVQSHSPLYIIISNKMKLPQTYGYKSFSR